jgi:hypothetical protein
MYEEKLIVLTDDEARENTHNDDSWELLKRARQLYPNPRNAAKWVRSVQYLRRHNLWILEGGKRPNWGKASV